jgi:hypothetical protein
MNARHYLILISILFTASVQAQKVGINTLDPQYSLDVRGTDDALEGGELQLATPGETNFLRLFGGRINDPHPFLAFSELDTFHLVTTSADWSTYTRRMTVTPNGKIGIGTDLPVAEIDLRTPLLDDGASLHMANADQSHFLRLFSGRQGLPYPILYWNHGSPLEFGQAHSDDSDYKVFVTLDGKTIGVHNTGRSVFIGRDAGGSDNTTDNENVAVGDSAMALTTNSTGNIAIGTRALKAHSSGNQNTAIGFEAMGDDQTGQSNIAIGAYALKDNDDGYENTAIGHRAMQKRQLGNSNVAVGKNALYSNLSGDSNTALGREALTNNVSGSGNVAIGRHAGKSETGSNKLYIANTSTSNPLIYGEFDNQKLKINGELTVSDLAGTGDRNLIVDTNGKFKIGTLGGDTDWVETATRVSTTREVLVNAPGAPTSSLAVTGKVSNGNNFASLALWNNAFIGGGTYDRLLMDANDIDAFRGISVPIGEALHLNRLSSGNVNIANGGGNVGIGVPGSASKLTIEGPDNNGSIAALEIRSQGNGQTMLIDGNEIDITTGNLHFNANSGRPVSIGTLQIADGYQLTVKGKIMAEEVRVQLQAAWPDYVFEQDYALMPLSELEKEIVEKGHLPGIPAAYTIEKEGVDTGEMQRKMMEKIEELTLHLIDLNKKVVALESELESHKK